ncbi:hypothetical protein RJ55_03693 [Drechmeria coniospora]|nr:hypothetical protein RJ55_03693 [Drechmeria coniospora]
MLTVAGNFCAATIVTLTNADQTCVPALKNTFDGEESQKALLGNKDEKGLERKETDCVKIVDRWAALHDVTCQHTSRNANCSLSTKGGKGSRHRFKNLKLRVQLARGALAPAGTISVNVGGQRPVQLFHNPKPGAFAEVDVDLPAVFGGQKEVPFETLSKLTILYQPTPEFQHGFRLDMFEVLDVSLEAHDVHSGLVVSNTKYKHLDELMGHSDTTKLLPVWHGDFRLEDWHTSLSLEPRQRAQGQANGKPTASKPSKLVFYGDFLWPDEAKRQGGFLTPADRLARSRNPPMTAFSLQTYVKEQPSQQQGTYFLRTYETFGSAAKDAAAQAAKWGGATNPVVYVVHATPNMIETEKGVAAAGGILWSQVVAWAQVPHNYTLPADIPKTREGVREHFAKAFHAHKLDIFEKNDDYDSRFDQYSINQDAQPQLWSTEKAQGALLDFMRKYGKAVGFGSKFPLFAARELIDGKKSAEAKRANAVQAPHDEGFLSMIGNLIKNHPVAAALIPAAIALSLVPGLGLAIDALEITALSTEAVVGTGLLTDMAESTALIEGGVEAGVDAGVEGEELGSIELNDLKPLLGKE